MEENGMFELTVSIRAANHVHACNVSVVDLNLYSMHITNDVRKVRNDRKRKLWVDLGLQPPKLPRFYGLANLALYKLYVT